MSYEDPYYIPPDSYVDEDEPYWTRRRIVYLVVVAIIILTLLATTIGYGILRPLTQPAPAPPTPPAQRIEFVAPQTHTFGESSVNLRHVTLYIRGE